MQYEPIEWWQSRRRSIYSAEKFWRYRSTNWSNYRPALHRPTIHLWYRCPCSLCHYLQKWARNQWNSSKLEVRYRFNSERWKCRQHSTSCIGWTYLYLPRSRNPLFLRSLSKSKHNIEIACRYAGILRQPQGVRSNHCASLFIIRWTPQQDDAPVPGVCEQPSP